VAPLEHESSASTEVRLLAQDGIGVGPMPVVPFNVSGAALRRKVSKTIRLLLMTDGSPSTAAPILRSDTCTGNDNIE
jgi:hypothetical protein